MFDAGLVEETQVLLQKYGRAAGPLGSLGYGQAVQLLQGDLTREQAVQAAQQALAVAQAQAAQAEAAAQNTLATAQGQASVATAQAQQSLQAIQDTAAQQEAIIQGEIAVTQAEAQTQYAGSGLVVNLYGLNPSDAQANATELGWLLRTQLPSL